MPAEVLELTCDGDHHAMGAQQGALLAARPIFDDLASILDLWGRSPRRRLLRLPLPALAWLLAHAGRRTTRRRFGELVPRQRARLEGLASGGALSPHQVYLATTLELMFAAAASAGAVTVAVGPRRSADGTPFLVKNIDAPAGRPGPYLVRHNHPDGALADHDLTDIAMAGSLDGVNEAGLALSCNHRIFSSPGSARVPPSLLCKELLERCETVDQCLRHIQRWPATQSSLLTLIDRGGGLAEVDITDRVQVQRPGDLSIQANHGLTGAQAWPAWRRPLPGKLGHDGLGPSRQRQRRLTALLGDEPLTRARLAAALADHDGAPRDASVCRHGSYLKTRCQLILNCEDATIDVRPGLPCGAGGH